MSTQTKKDWSEILDQDTVTIEVEIGMDSEVVTVGWADDYVCECIMTTDNGVLYIETKDGYKGVGVIIVNHGWNKLAMTAGGSYLGNVHNTGWFSYDSRKEWEAYCEYCENR